MKKTAKKLHNEDTQMFFEPIAKTFLKESGVTEGKMFGTSVLKIKGKVFAFPMKGNLVVKLPKERVAEIVASKKGVYFDPGHGRISKEWVAVKPSTEKHWMDLVKEAKDFVAQILK